MNRKLPTIAMLLGIGGLIPFVACGLGALATTAPADGLCLLALVAYGAVILAFLGGVHWGFGLDEAGAAPLDVQRARFGLGVVPSLIGWVALLIAILSYGRTAVAVLAVGFIMTTATEARASRHGYMPKGYMGLRWVLSAVVVICLVTVWTVLLFNGRIVL
ncbi:MAG: DUF3429 domain-containing protein [Acetobacteraceae bacterium]|nr:DUF3429 domain-containing protein [Acetobacteraceae bacterium]